MLLASVGIVSYGNNDLYKLSIVVNSQSLIQQLEEVKQKISQVLIQSLKI